MRERSNITKFEIPRPGIVECVFSALAAVILIYWYMSIEDKSFVEPVMIFYQGMIALLLAGAVGAFFKRWWIYIPATCGAFVLAGLYAYKSNWWLIYSLTDATTNVALFMAVTFGIIIPAWIIMLMLLPVRPFITELMSLGAPVLCVYVFIHFKPIYGSVEGIKSSVMMLPIAVFAAFGIMSFGIFLYNCSMGHDPYRCDYWGYAPCALRGYYFSEFYKQTRIPKKFVKDYGKKRTAEKSGNYGEYSAYYWLNRLLPGKKKFLFGLIIPEADGSFQELDVVCFWRNKIILCEAKSYGGHILCDYNSPSWTSIYTEHMGNFETESEVKFTNPAFQNWQHRIALSAFLDEKGILKSDMIESIVFFTNKYEAIEPIETKHDIRFNNVPEGITLQKFMKKGFIRELCKSDPKSPTREDVEKAYEALNSLKKHSKAELRGMCQRRADSSMYRTDTSRVQTYYLDEANKRMYRRNALYTEVLIVGPFGGLWHYAGESKNTDIPSSAVAVSNPEYAYSKLCNVGVSRFHVELNGKPVNVGDL